jgi:hypothetical protein
MGGSGGIGDSAAAGFAAGSAGFAARGASAGFTGGASTGVGALSAETIADAGFPAFPGRPLTAAVSPAFLPGAADLAALAGVDFLVPASGAAAFLLPDLAETGFCGLVFFSFAVSRGVGLPFPIMFLFLYSTEFLICRPCLRLHCHKP